MTGRLSSDERPLLAYTVEKLVLKIEAISFAFCGHFLTVVTKGTWLAVEDSSWSASVADRAA
jgi:hypothetical protein